MAGIKHGVLRRTFLHKKVHVRRTFVPSPSHPTPPHPTPPHPRLSDPELLQQRLLSSPLNLQPESMIHRNPILIEFGSESAARSIMHRKTVVIELEFGSESAAQSRSILHRNPHRIRFAGPLAARVCDPSESSRTPPVLIEFGSAQHASSRRYSLQYN